jgi:hypothetical protein
LFRANRPTLTRDDRFLSCLKNPLIQTSSDIVLGSSSKAMGQSKLKSVAHSQKYVTMLIAREHLVNMTECYDTDTKSEIMYSTMAKIEKSLPEELGVADN